MKQMLEQYASAVIAVFLTGILFMIVVHSVYGNNLGISQVLGFILQDSIGEIAIVENGIMEDYVRGTAIELKEKNVYLTVGKESLISDYFEAKNSAGEIFPLWCEVVWNHDRRILDVEKIDQGKKICFDKEGAYWIQLATMDKNDNRHSWIVKVLVNER